MEINLEVKNGDDILTAREEARQLAAKLGFSGTNLSLIGSAVSELARSLLIHGSGKITLKDATEGEPALVVIVRDGHAASPAPAGHPNNPYAAHDLSLPTVRRVMDELKIESDPLGGRTLIATKRLSLRASSGTA